MISIGDLLTHDLLRNRTVPIDRQLERLVADAKADKGYFGNLPTFWLGDGETPNYRFDESTSLQHMAQEAGEHPSETFLRMTRESRGKALFTMRMFNPNMGALAELISGDAIFPGLGDAGAHVGQVMDSGWCSFVLSHWVREKGLFSKEVAVRRMSSARSS